MKNVKFAIFSILILLGFILGLNFVKLQSLLKSGYISNISDNQIISPSELKKKLENKNFTLINVHTPYEGEIEKTDLFIDYDSLISNKEKLPQDKSSEIILYCKSGKMSQEALNTLQSLGYVNVRHLVGGMNEWKKKGYSILDLSKLPSDVLPESGYTLPISWEDIGPRLVNLGVIDETKFENTVKPTPEQKEILTKATNKNITINKNNSQFVVDLLWALGLAQKSQVYEDGPMGKEYKKDVTNFSSTAGWTLSQGNSMSHYNKHDLLGLTLEQHQLVMKISGNVFRPCCGNSTIFPDCNHGMAALAAIELMVKKGISEDEIYKNVLALNSFWFPQNYLTIATYKARQGVNWNKVDAKEILGQNYSSGQGISKITKEVGPLPYDSQFGSGCGA